MYLRTLLATAPYPTNTIKVIPMNTALSPHNAAVGDAVLGAIKSGKNAKKKRVNFGFSRLSKTALVIMCHQFVVGDAAATLNAPRSCHIAHARYRR